MTDFFINTLSSSPQWLCKVCKEYSPEWATRKLGKAAKGYVQGSDNHCVGHRMTEFDRKMLSYNKRRG